MAKGKYWYKKIEILCVNCGKIEVKYKKMLTSKPTNSYDRVERHEDECCIEGLN